MATRDRRANIGTGIWSEQSIRQLTRRQRDAYFLVYTQPDLNRCGVLPYRPRYWAKLATDSPEPDLEQDFRDLHNTRHVIVDDNDELLLIRTYVKHDGLLSQPLVVASMIRDYHRVTSPLIRTAFLAEIRRLWEDPDLDHREHQGVELILGAHPNTLGMRGADKLANAIGGGLLGPLLGAIADGHVDPFPSRGLPKGLTEGQLEGLTNPRTRTAPATAPATAPVPATATAPALRQIPTLTDTLLDEHAAAYTTRPAKTVLDAVRRHIDTLLDDHIDENLIRAGLTKMRAKQLAPRNLPELVTEVTPTHPEKLTAGQQLNRELGLA